MIVVLRYVAHQKGTYYTHEEALTFKSDPDVQIVQEIQDSQEDSEEGECLDVTLVTTSGEI